MIISSRLEFLLKEVGIEAGRLHGKARWLGWHYFHHEGGGRMMDRGLGRIRGFGQGVRLGASEFFSLFKALTKFGISQPAEGRGGGHVSVTDCMKKGKHFRFWASLFPGDAATQLASFTRVAINGHVPSPNVRQDATIDAQQAPPKSMRHHGSQQGSQCDSQDAGRQRKPFPWASLEYFGN